MTEYGLGRLAPTDDLHVRRYSLSADSIPSSPTPVILGVDWFTGFDKAGLREFDGGVWIGRSPRGTVRGGHAICLKPPALTDPAGAYAHHNQGEEGRCVGEATTRASALTEGRLFDAEKLYVRAKEVDEFPGTDYSGTSVRAGLSVAQKEGLHLVRGGKSAAKPSDRWRIGPYFWASSVEQIAACLKLPTGQQYVEFLNSWGASYPHLTRIAFDLLHDLLFVRGGDAAVAVNLPKRPGLGGAV